MPVARHRPASVTCRAGRICRTVAAAAAERHGGIDVLCANAGIYPQTKIEDMDPDEWDSGDGHKPQERVSRYQGLSPAPQEQ